MVKSVAITIRGHHIGNEGCCIGYDCSGWVHCNNFIVILTIEYGYHSFMFDLSTPGTEQM